MRAERAKGIHAGIDFIADGPAGRLFVDVIDGAADRVEARHDRGRAFQELDLRQAGSIHPTGGDVRWSGPNSVVEDVHLGAAEPPHGKIGRCAGGVARQDADGALGGVGRGAIALLLDGSLSDDLHRRGSLYDGQPQARGALRHIIQRSHRYPRERRLRRRRRWRLICGHWNGSDRPPCRTPFDCGALRRPLPRHAYLRKWLRPRLCLLWFRRVLRNGCGRFQDESGKEGREGRNEKTAAAMAAVKADRKHVTPQRRQTSRHRDFG